MTPRFRVSALLGMLAVLSGSVASGQVYETPRPQPQTTDGPTLRAIAVRREIHERFTLAFAAQAKGDLDRAGAEFERILALDPPEPQGSTAHYDLALVDAKTGRTAAAATQLRAAIALDSGFLAAMANLISIDLALGDLSEARRIADRFVALAPDSARALYSRGIVALRTGDDVTAKADFGKLLADNPAYAVAHYDLGLAEERLGRYDAAEREFRDALSLSPSYARARFALGAILLHEGRREDARVAFAAVADDPNGDPALRNIASAMRDATAAPR
jgi:tetratricopeptide (TPR) repeat protein